MNTEQFFYSHSEKETEEFAFSLAKKLPVGSVIALRGDLGAGKTVFSRGFARGLGITEPVSSPTYTIVQEYMLTDSKRLYHLDLYRIEDEADALAFGVEEFLNDPEAWTILEWSERIEGILPSSLVVIELRHISAEEREIKILRMPDV